MAYFEENGGRLEAMDSEVYVNGVLSTEANGPAKITKKKSKKKRELTFIEKIPRIFRGLWATRQTENIDKEKEVKKYVKITMRELCIYAVFLINLSVLSLGMAPSTIFDFSNVISGAFIGSPTKNDPYTTFMDINHMNDIWAVSFR